MRTETGVHVPVMREMNAESYDSIELRCRNRLREADKRHGSMISIRDMGNMQYVAIEQEEEMFFIEPIHDLAVLRHIIGLGRSRVLSRNPDLLNDNVSFPSVVLTPKPPFLSIVRHGLASIASRGIFAAIDAISRPADHFGRFDANSLRRPC
ncbi:MAG: hypothetical protein AAAB20_27160 [Rhizobium sp.]|uniref:hypothetical protein n=1 Tax=Rhizobium sp. TaxID=391 RepID=UPI0030F11FAB